VASEIVLLRKIRSAGTRLRQALLSQRFGFHPSVLYGDSFYDGSGCAQSREAARNIARVLGERYAPHSVFDFGCGEGALLNAFQEANVEACGCEGSIHGVRRASPRTLVFQADLKRPVVLNRRFDLVTCIEVGEHLPKRAAPRLVASIAAAADRRVVFSASSPGERGDDHITLREPEWWAALFEGYGFRFDEPESRLLRRLFKEADAPEWLRFAIVLERYGSRPS